MSKSAVFISYRRDDCPGYAGRLEDALERAFGIGRVFRDVRDIAAGENFSDVIKSSLAQANVVLVLIGPRWLGPLPDGKHRIDDPGDFVCMEVAAALTSAHKVVPVLLAGATLPQTNELPESLHALTSRQALTLNEASWDADLQRLIDSLGLPRTNKRRTLLIATLVIAVVCIGAGMYLRKPAVVSDPIAAQTELTTATLTGTWETTTKLNYGWGDTYQERFEIKLFAGGLTGTASYLEYPRGIENLSVRGNTFNFVTHTVETVNDQERQLTHSYSGELKNDTLFLRLQTTGGSSSLMPVEFTATRQVSASPIATVPR